jgi:hypothetical protein
LARLDEAEACGRVDQSPKLLGEVRVFVVGAAWPSEIDISFGDAVTASTPEALLCVSMETNEQNSPANFATSKSFLLGAAGHSWMA